MKRPTDHNSLMRTAYPKGTLLHATVPAVKGTVIELVEDHQLDSFVDGERRHVSNVRTRFKVIKLGGAGLRSGWETYVGTTTTGAALAQTGSFSQTFWHANRFVPLPTTEAGNNTASDKSSRRSIPVDLDGADEGAIREVLRKIRARSARLSAVAKARYQAQVGQALPCQHCGFSFYETHGMPYIEAAHLDAIKDRPQEGSWTSIDGFFFLCSNCHVVFDREDD